MVPFTPYSAFAFATFSFHLCSVMVMVRIWASVRIWGAGLSLGLVSRS